MSVTKLYTLYGVNIENSDDTDLFISQIQDWNFDAGIAELIEAGDGVVDPTFAAVGAQRPKIAFTSSKIASILATIGIGGIDIESDGDDAGAEFWLQKIAEGGTRASGNNHMKLTMNKGMIFVRQISATNDRMATVSMEALATYDGSNAPFVVATSQALSGSVGSSEGYVCGPVVINGTTLEAVQEITIDFGIQETFVSGDGEVYPTFAAIMSRRPIITVRTLDVESLSTFGLSGVAQGATDSVVYLRKVSEGGTRVADGTGEHISFTVDEGRIAVQTIPASDGEPAMAEVKITPTYDGSNAIIAISTTATIS
jgi:hypothetical protein